LFIKKRLNKVKTMNNHKAETTSSKASFSLDEPTRIRNGMYISRSLAAIIMIFYIAILLTVGLLAGLLAKRTSTETYYYVLDDSTTTTTSPSSPSPQTLSTTTPDPFGIGPWQNIRLPKEIKPINYNLSIYDINTVEGKYEGKTIIQFSLTNNLKHIMFHVKNLTIDASNVKLYLDNSIVSTGRQFQYTRNQFYVLESNEEFKQGEYRLDIVYTGYTNIGIVGMYQSSYNQNGTKK
jgi:hypothetical protein